MNFLKGFRLFCRKSKSYIKRQYKSKKCLFIYCTPPSNFNVVDESNYIYETSNYLMRRGIHSFNVNYSSGLMILKINCFLFQFEREIIVGDILFLMRDIKNFKFECFEKIEDDCKDSLLILDFIKRKFRKYFEYVAINLVFSKESFWIGFYTLFVSPDVIHKTRFRSRIFYFSFLPFFYFKLIFVSRGYDRCLERIFSYTDLNDVLIGEGISNFHVGIDGDGIVTVEVKESMFNFEKVKLENYITDLFPLSTKVNFKFK